MSTRAYQPPRDDYVPDGTELKQDHPHSIARAWLLPRIAARHHRAVKTIKTKVFFYSKIRAGRRCSCYDIEVSPASICRACFGTGIVGGYLKHGTELFTLDVTFPNVRGVNVLPSQDRKAKPTPFALIKGATFGFVEFTVPLGTNVGKADAFLPITKVPENGTLDAFLKGPADGEFVSFTDDAFRQRLFNPSLTVRVEFQRANALNESPKLSCLHVRYQRIRDMQVTVNIPRTERSQLLTDQGLTDSWQAQHFWTDNLLKSITTEDFVAEIGGSVRWKIHVVQDLAPEGQLLSWDIDTRLVHPYEPYSFVPL